MLYNILITFGQTFLDKTRSQNIQPQQQNRLGLEFSLGFNDVMAELRTGIGNYLIQQRLTWNFRYSLGLLICFLWEIISLFQAYHPCIAVWHGIWNVVPVTKPFPEQNVDKNIKWILSCYLIETETNNAAISQTTFSSALSWTKMHEFRLSLHRRLFLRF